MRLAIGIPIYMLVIVIVLTVLSLKGKIENITPMDNYVVTSSSFTDDG